MNIKELKGTMNLSDFAEGLVGQKKAKSLGEVWEDFVDCNHCPYTEQCKAISNHIQNEYDVNTYCRQTIDYLLGDMSIEGFLKEV
jgi:hypothetical protein